MQLRVIFSSLFAPDPTIGGHISCDTVIYHSPVEHSFSANGLLTEIIALFHHPVVHFRVTYFEGYELYFYFC